MIPAAREAGAVLGQRSEGHAEDCGPHQRAADPHQGPGHDQHGVRLRNAADRRHRGKDRGPDEKRATPPEDVGEAATGDDQDAEREGIGVDHPLDGRDVGAEVLLDRGEGDVHRREVIGDHDHAQTHREQGQLRLCEIELIRSRDKWPAYGKVVYVR